MLRTIAALTLLTATAAAEPVAHETVVHDTTRSVEITLDPSTVLCSSADYGALFFKILIPELAGMTLLDHQNLGAGAPCVAAGMCEPGNMPDDILDPYVTTEQVDINVKAIRIDEVDTAAGTCTTTLREAVAVEIRGKTFKHVRFASLGERPVSDCASAPVAPVTNDTPADDPGKTASRHEGGGCDTGGGGAWFAAVMMLALFAALRVRAKSPA